jgi:RNA polymerase sigma-70 factor (ECF subfamily)
MTIARGMSTRHQPTDEELVAALDDDTGDALAELYARLAPFVFGMAARAVDAAAAEDVVQDVFLTVWRQAHTFDAARGSVRAWIATITQSRVANELRRRRRRPVDGDRDGAKLARMTDDRPGPPDVAWRAFRRDALRAALDALPPPQRKALGLAYFEEMSHEQIASVLELPLGTVKTRIRSGMQKLRGWLPHLAAASLVALLAVLGVRHRAGELARDERALTLLTASDAQNLRLGATPGQAPETHARYRGRPGTPLAVVTLSSFPPAPAGRAYQIWVLHRGVWTSLGTVVPNADGSARTIAEGPALAAMPDAVEITIEPTDGSVAPNGPVMARWPEP